MFDEKINKRIHKTHSSFLKKSKTDQLQEKNLLKMVKTIKIQ